MTNEIPTPAEGDVEALLAEWLEASGNAFTQRGATVYGVRLEDLRQLIRAARAPAPAPHVGETRFEGWLSCHEPDRNANRTLRYSKQDMRDAYWAGYCERGAAPSPAPEPEVYEDDPEHTPEDNKTFRLLHAFEQYCRGRGHAWSRDRLVSHLWARFAAAQAPAVSDGQLHTAIRKVLKHHGLTKHGDGVVEADLIATFRGEAKPPVQEMKL